MSSTFLARHSVSLKPFALAAALALASGMAVHSAENYSEWSGVRSYRINTSSTGAFWEGTAANFPLLVRLSAGDTVLTQAKANGADIRFTKADSVTRLHHEIDTWNVASGAAIWVLVDQIQGNLADQVFMMHWGKPDAADSSKGTAVFSPANGYVGVWHMGGTGSETDATGNGNTAAAINAPGSAAGHIGGGRTLSRDASQHFVVADSASLNWTDPALTLSAWVNAADWAGSSRIFQKGTGGDAAQYGLRETSLDRFGFDVNGTNLNDAGSAVPEIGTWALVHALVDGVSRKIYLNGAEVATADYAGGNLATTTVPLHLGRQPEAANYFNGTLDEMRVQKVGRNAAWIALEYQNQAPGQTLVQIVTGGSTRIAGDRARDAATFSVSAHGTGILFRIDETITASVTVSDMRGAVVWDGSFPSGARELVWNSVNASNGLYVARLRIRDAQGKLSAIERRITLAR